MEGAVVVVVVAVVAVVVVAVVVAGAARHLQALLAELVLDRLLKAAVVDRRDLDAGEQVLDDRHEERDVVVQELGEVRVAERADQRDVLADLRVGALELPEGVRGGGGERWRGWRWWRGGGHGGKWQRVTCPAITSTDFTARIPKS